MRLKSSVLAFCLAVGLCGAQASAMTVNTNAMWEVRSLYAYGKYILWSLGRHRRHRTMFEICHQERCCTKQSCVYNL